LAALCAHSPAELVGIFGQYKYVGVSIDGVMIKCRKFLNLDIVNPISDTLPFTYDFFQDNTFDTVSFADGFAEFSVHIQTDGLNISRVTSDGCSFQVKALNWRDPESIQARGEQFSKLLFIPCICHRLQNAIITLLKENAHYCHLIKQSPRRCCLLGQTWSSRRNRGNMPGALRNPLGL
jgi:hypothetical protein